MLSFRKYKKFLGVIAVLVAQSIKTSFFFLSFSTLYFAECVWYDFSFKNTKRVTYWPHPGCIPFIGWNNGWILHILTYFSSHIYLNSGASSGLGVETTRVLTLRGVHVIMAVRNTDAGKNVKEQILKEIPNAKIDVMELDLSSMGSVRKFASDYNASGLPLNLLM